MAYLGLGLFNIRTSSMVKGSSIARLKKRAQQALEKDPKDRTYKEVNDISNWTAVTERWEAMKGNQYATGVVRSEKTREKMRAAQRMSKSGSYM